MRLLFIQYVINLVQCSEQVDKQVQNVTIKQYWIRKQNPRPKEHKKPRCKNTRIQELKNTRIQDPKKTRIQDPKNTRIQCPKYTKNPKTQGTQY